MNSKASVVTSAVYSGLGKAETRSHAQAVFFYFCFLVVVAVSVHDAFLVVLTQHVIEQTELNPIGRWLICCQDGGVWVFVGAKLVGTILACSILLTLFEHRRRLAVPAGAALAAFQVILLLYLSFA